MIQENGLPHAPETERLILGSVFIDESLFMQIADLETNIFYNPRHRYAFSAMKNLFARNEPINPITVFGELQNLTTNSSIERAEMTMWTYGLPHATNLDVYVSQLRDKALKRDVIRKCNEISTVAADDSDLGAEIVGRAVSTFQDVYSTSLNGHKPTVALSEALKGNYERWDRMLRKEIVTIETGLPIIDDNLTGGGFEKGMFHIIGARPGKGKTTLGLDIAAHNIFNGNVVVFFTMELSKDVLMDRFIAPLAGVQRFRITAKWMDAHTKQVLVAVSESIKERQLFVNDRARTLKDMRLALKEVARATGGKIDLIITDFLTKMRNEKGNKYESVSENANGLAEFATEFGAASICLAQLNRGNERRTTLDPEQQGKVTLIDFRDSGEIEELGRTILGLWGSDDSRPYRNVKVSCIKQGEGGLFDADAVFDTDFMTFGVRQKLMQAASPAL